MRKVPKGASVLRVGLATLGLLLSCISLEGAERTRLHLALDGTIRSLDPRQIADQPAEALAELIHCSLMRYDAEGQPVPALAASKPQWKSPTSLEVSIRDSVKFSDGSAVTAEDVAATWQALLHGDKPIHKAWRSRLKTVRAQGRTVLFTLADADAGFASRLTLGILPARFAREKLYDPLKAPNCGPYSVHSLQGDRILLKANPHDGGSPALQLHEIELDIVTSEADRLARLQSGELDLVQNSINRVALNELARKNPRLKVLRRPGLNTSYLGFNMRDPRTGLPAVREAISHAINRQEIISNVLAGVATPASSLLPPASPFHHPSPSGRSWDPGQAEKLLDAAGFPRKGSQRFELSLGTTHDITHIHVAKAIASQLERIGIKLVVQPQEKETLGRHLENGDMQLWVLTRTDLRDPDAYRQILSAGGHSAAGETPGWPNRMKLNALLDQGRRTINPEQRLSIYKTVQELVDQDLPIIHLWHDDNYAIINRSLQGFSLSADGRYRALTEAFFSP